MGQQALKNLYGKKSILPPLTFAKVCFSSLNFKTGENPHPIFKTVHFTSLAQL
jgi:hypothetical protein